MAITSLTPPSLRSIVTGPMNWIQYESDGCFNIPANDGISFDAGTWTFTRTALGQYAMLRTAAAATNHVVVNLGLALQKYGSDPLHAPAPYTHTLRGFELTSFDVMYDIITANITSLSASLAQSVFANNTTITTNTTPGGTLTGSFVTTASGTAGSNINVTNVSLATGYVIGNNAADTMDFLELTLVAPSSAVFSLYGITLYGNYLYD